MSRCDDDDDNEAPVDRFAAALRLLDAAANAKSVAAGIRRLRKLRSDIATAEQKLESAMAKATGIVEAAKCEAERIIKEAQDQVASEVADREERARQAAFQERVDRVRAANPAWTDHQVLCAITEEEDKGHGAPFRSITTNRGTTGEEFVTGSTLRRSVPL